MKTLRRKKLRIFIMCVFLSLFCLRPSEAKSKKQPALKPKAQPAASQAMIENIKSALTANPWPVYIIYQERIKGEISSLVEADVLTFTQDAVSSRNLASQGYAKDGSGYKVKAGTGGGYVWESIQLHENQVDTVLLKGELKDGLMKGVIVYQPQGKPGRTVNFTTVRPK